MSNSACSLSAKRIKSYFKTDKKSNNKTLT
jgi:hypothetical protein